MLTNSQLISIAANNAIGPSEEIQNFLILHNFLLNNPEAFGWRSKKKPDLTQIDGVQKLAEKYYEKRYSKVMLNETQTVPDEMVSKILKKYFNYDEEKLNLIKREHQQSMAIENMVGELLERYIDSVLSKHGWVWCCGSLVKKIDFIKIENNKYRLIQIKNRDNSENSSSSAIRDGTTIEKWFRTYSQTGKTNWNNFPDEQLKSHLSENGFIEFVEKYL